MLTVPTRGVSRSKHPTALARPWCRLQRQLGHCSTRRLCREAPREAGHGELPMGFQRLARRKEGVLISSGLCIDIQLISATRRRANSRGCDLGDLHSRTTSSLPRQRRKECAWLCRCSPAAQLPVPGPAAPEGASRPRAALSARSLRCTFIRPFTSLARNGVRRRRMRKPSFAAFGTPWSSPRSTPKPWASCSTRSSPGCSARGE